RLQIQNDQTETDIGGRIQRLVAAVTNGVCLNARIGTRQRQFKTRFAEQHRQHEIDVVLAARACNPRFKQVQRAVKKTCRQSQIQMHPVVEHTVIHRQIEMTQIQVRLYVTFKYLPVKGRADRPLSNLIHTQIGQAQVGQYRNRMFERRTKARVFVVAESEIILQI